MAFTLQCCQWKPGAVPFSPPFQLPLLILQVEVGLNGLIGLSMNKFRRSKMWPLFRKLSCRDCPTPFSNGFHHSACCSGAGQGLELYINIPTSAWSLILTIMVLKLASPPKPSYEESMISPLGRLRVTSIAERDGRRIRIFLLHWTVV